MDNEPIQLDGKEEIRRSLRQRISALTEAERHAKSIAACALVAGLQEFRAAQTIMVYLSTPTEVDTAPLALRAWQQGKTVVVPKVSWDARRMVPVEISSLSSDQVQLTTKGFREPIAGNPVPLSFIDMVIVPGLGFTASGHRLGRGMGFYDRFLAQPEFIGFGCGLCFEEQVIPFVPMLDHDVPLCMLATDRGIRRIGAACSGT
ncbi:MAG: 5-formyltetrahydrofolate cyclo-ligase [Tepidisphaeraceae bacterium]